MIARMAGGLLELGKIAFSRSGALLMQGFFPWKRRFPEAFCIGATGARNFCEAAQYLARSMIERRLNISRSVLNTLQALT